MSVSVTIQDNGTFAALANMRNMRTIELAITTAAYMLKNEQMIYPRAFPHKQPLKTPLQRKAFFAKLKDGTIIVPYPRAQTLANSWEVNPHGMYTDVGTRYDKAPLMKSAKMAQYHRVTGWESAPLTTMRIEPRLVNAIHSGIRQWVG